MTNPSCRSFCAVSGSTPAVVSGLLITTIVDGTGLIIYFEIARYLLKL